MFSLINFYHIHVGKNEVYRWFPYVKKHIDHQIEVTIAYYFKYYLKMHSFYPNTTFWLVVQFHSKFHILKKITSCICIQWLHGCMLSKTIYVVQKNHLLKFTNNWAIGIYQLKPRNLIIFPRFSTSFSMVSISQIKIMLTSSP